MASKSSQDNTFTLEEADFGLKLQHLWERTWPGLRCVAVIDPEKTSGNAQTTAYNQLATYINLGYRPIPMSADDRIKFCRNAQMMLMGIDRNVWAAREARRHNQPAPDETTTRFAVGSQEGRTEDGYKILD